MLHLFKLYSLLEFDDLNKCFGFTTTEAQNYLDIPNNLRDKGYSVDMVYLGKKDNEYNIQFIIRKPNEITDIDNLCKDLQLDPKLYQTYKHNKQLYERTLAKKKDQFKLEAIKFLSQLREDYDGNCYRLIENHGQFPEVQERLKLRHISFVFTDITMQGVKLTKILLQGSFNQPMQLERVYSALLLDDTLLKLKRTNECYAQVSNLRYLTDNLIQHGACKLIARVLDVGKLKKLLFMLQCREFNITYFEHKFFDRKCVDIHIEKKDKTTICASDLYKALKVPNFTHTSKIISDDTELEDTLNQYLAQQISTQQSETLGYQSALRESTHSDILTHFSALKLNDKPTSAKLFNRSSNELPSWCICSLTKETMQEPVYCGIDEATYEKAAFITYCLDNKETPGNNAIPTDYDALLELITPDIYVKSVIDAMSVTTQRTYQSSVN